MQDMCAIATKAGYPHEFDLLASLWKGMMNFQCMFIKKRKYITAYNVQQSTFNTAICAKMNCIYSSMAPVRLNARIVWDI